MSNELTTAGSTGDYNTTGGYGVYYPTHYSLPYHCCPSYPCPICNPPAYYPVPYYVPVPAPYTVGTIIFQPDTELKEEVKGLKEEIKKLRKELAKK